MLLARPIAACLIAAALAATNTAARHAAAFAPCTTSLTATTVAAGLLFSAAAAAIGGSCATSATSTAAASPIARLALLLAPPPSVLHTCLCTARSLRQYKGFAATSKERTQQQLPASRPQGALMSSEKQTHTQCIVFVVVLLMLRFIVIAAVATPGSLPAASKHQLPNKPSPNKPSTSRQPAINTLYSSRSLRAPANCTGNLPDQLKQQSEIRYCWRICCLMPPCVLLPVIPLRICCLLPPCNPDSCCTPATLCLLPPCDPVPCCAPAYLLPAAALRICCLLPT
jgi:hypothetical protein